MAVGADAIHPGYGFLSENPTLAQGCVDNAIIFVGPSADVIEKVGNKVTAREVAERAGVPVSPGFRLPDKLTKHLAKRLETEIGYPLLIKAVHGGGGRGMRVVQSPVAFVESAEAAAAEAGAAFGNSALYVEHFVARARHVEIQIMGLPGGIVLVLGDRDCSVQRRHQKLIEEAPAPTLADELRTSLHNSAKRIGELLGYENAGTVEFVVDDATGEYFFLEVNSRLQVEHPVTEAVTGIDIVRTQFEIASGAPLDAHVRDEPQQRGVAIECRINAENPELNFQPSPGRLLTWQPPTFGCARIDTHCYSGYVVPPYYDSLLAKVIAYGGNREEAVENMAEALRTFTVEGVSTTISWATSLVTSSEFRSNQIHTRWVDELNRLR
jgi:acetyl-CoA carboxylase biotin carboxylase subunit